MTGILDWSHHRHGSWFHCSVDTVKRSAGRSAVAAAAYVTGKRLHEEGREEPHDYTRRNGVIASFTVAPAHAPEWVFDPEALWNAAENAERRGNSVVARKSDIALPYTVSPEEREAIAADIAAELVRRYNVAVTVAIHEPDRHGDQRNHHAHLVWTTREVTEEGLGKKTRILDDIKTTGPREITSVREFVADRINQALDENGSDERVTAQSYAIEGINKVPTTHLGPAASGIERKGGQSSRGDLNREAQAKNARLAELVEEYAQAEAEIVALEERRLDARYGPADIEEAESYPPLSKEPTPEPPVEYLPLRAAAPEPAVQYEPLPQSPEEEEARLEQDAAPLEAHIRAGRDIPMDAIGSTWWQRMSAYGYETVRAVVSAVRETWQRVVSSRREAAPERDPWER